MDAAAPTGRPIDPWAIDGKFPAADEHAQLLVIGAGPAGLAAAIEAASVGLRVVLIDENPVAAALMGLDVPLFYGQRMNPAVQESARMVERLVAATPSIEAAFDAGVDVRLGVTAWGVFANGPAVNALPGRVAGLSDGEKSWMCGFDALILATGARDLVLGFEGVELPGVMGARALHSLLTRYDAFDGKRLVILGSGDLAVTTALAALDRGVEVAALIEVLPEPQAAIEQLAALAARGVPVRCGTAILRAEGDATGVVAASVIRIGTETPERLACDTICLAIGAVPAIELAGALGCSVAFRGDLGGHVPLTSEHGATSVAGVFVGLLPNLPATPRAATPRARPPPVCKFPHRRPGSRGRRHPPSTPPNTASPGCAPCWKPAECKPPSACARTSTAPNSSASARPAISTAPPTKSPPATAKPCSRTAR
jgi:thioredoxin reductase